MSVSLITDGFYDEFIELVASAESEIRIVSPFLGRQRCVDLANTLSKNANVSCRIITRFYREDFIQGVSSLDGLETLLDAGATAMALKKLHAKVYVFDQEHAVVTSANFTTGGLLSNIEVGLLLKSEPEIVTACIEFFDDLWRSIQEWSAASGESAKITTAWIEEEKEQTSRLINNRKVGIISHNSHKKGADLRTIKEPDRIERLVGEVSTDKHSTNWLKFEADSQHRHDSEEPFRSPHRRAFTQARTFFPTRPIGIKSGDRLFLAVVSYDRGGNPAPLIVGYALTPGFNDANEVSSDDPSFESWMGHYRYFVELEETRFIDGPVKHGISIIELYREIGHRTYPSTFSNPSIELESLKVYHHQKDKIRITATAADYLTSKLDKLFLEFGSVQL